MPKGNKTAKGTLGNKGGSGRPLLEEQDKLTKHVRMSQRLFDKIQEATMKACECDWRAFLEALIDKNKKV